VNPPRAGRSAWISGSVSRGRTTPVSGVSRNPPANGRSSAAAASRPGPARRRRPPSGSRIGMRYRNDLGSLRRRRTESVPCPGQPTVPEPNRRIVLSWQPSPQVLTPDPHGRVPAGRRASRNSLDRTSNDCATAPEPSHSGLHLICSTPLGYERQRTSMTIVPPGCHRSGETDELERAPPRCGSGVPLRIPIGSLRAGRQSRRRHSECRDRTEVAREKPTTPTIATS